MTDAVKVLKIRHLCLTNGVLAMEKSRKASATAILSKKGSKSEKASILLLNGLKVSKSDKKS